VAATAQASVVVITYNRAEEAVRTVGRLRALPEAPAIIVVDNASEDDTRARLQAAHSQVPVIALPVNLGAAARNVGMRIAVTPYVALCDDDTWWEPG
jgi:GT2 family glycosyltransferase